jgi:hypothetical protein
MITRWLLKEKSADTGSLSCAYLINCHSCESRRECQACFGRRSTCRGHAVSLQCLLSHVPHGCSKQNAGNVNFEPQIPHTHLLSFIYYHCPWLMVFFECFTHWNGHNFETIPYFQFQMKQFLGAPNFQWLVAKWNPMWWCPGLTILCSVAG